MEHLTGVAAISVTVVAVTKMTHQVSCCPAARCCMVSCVPYTMSSYALSHICVCGCVSQCGFVCVLVFCLCES